VAELLVIQRIFWRIFQHIFVAHSFRSLVEQISQLWTQDVTGVPRECVRSPICYCIPKQGRLKGEATVVENRAQVSHTLYN